MKPSRFNRISASSLAAMAMASSAHAADGTWTQLTSGLWSNTENWSGGTIADGSGSTANFSTLNINPDNTVHLDSSRTLTNLVFGDTNPSHGWILGNNGVAGNILTLAGTTPTITVGALGAGKTATINAGIAGSGGLIKDGVGTLNLGTSVGGVLTSGGTANLTGGVTIKAGTLGLVGTIGSGAITLGDTTGGSTAAATLNVVGLGTNGNVPAYTNAIVLGATSGTLTINATTSGQLTLSGGVSGTNNLTIAENNASTGTMTFSTGSLNNTGTISNAGTGAAGTGVIISSVIGSNVTGLIQNGTTKLVLTNANTAFIGDTTLTSGNLNLRNTDSLQKSVLRMNGGSVTFGVLGTGTGNLTNNVNINSAALGGLNGTGNVDLINKGVSLGAVNLTIGNSNASYGGNTLNPTYSGVLSNTNGTASLTKTGSNTQTLTGANTYTGLTTISAGTLSVASIGNGEVAGNLGKATNDAANIVFNGGTLKYTGASDTSDRAFTINAGKTATIDTTNDLTLAGATGTATNGALTKLGSGTLALTGANTHTGGTTVSQGTLAFHSGSMASPITVQNAAFLGFTVGSPITSTSSVTLDSGSKIKISGAHVSPASYTLITADLGISGTPVLDAAITGYTLALESGNTVLKLNYTGGGSNYASWANDPTKGNIPGEPASGDFDNDGLSNLTEYALGKNPRTSSQSAGDLLGSMITFTKGSDAIANGDVSWVIETSETLANDWAPAVTQLAGDAALTISYTFTPGTPAKKFARLKVTQN